MKILGSIRYLARQRLSLRSHNDSESNFRQLLLLRAEDDPGIASQKKTQFTSSVIQN